ncbi:MAG: diaminopimelate decarboxylase [Erysipelotrichaceae bacterium]
MIEKINTPYFLINEESLEMNISEFLNAINKYFKQPVTGYSFKTNSLPWIINKMNQHDFYAEVVSFDEYKLALKLNYKKSKIIYNGPMKDKETYLDAITNGSIVNIETKRELRWLKGLDKTKKYKVGLRVNFDIESLCPNESVCLEEGGRFGFSLECGELEDAIKVISNLKNIELSGLHLHTSSKTRSLKIYETLAKVAVKIIHQYNLELDYIDIGGGFYGGLPGKPTFEEYFAIIYNQLKKISYFSKLTLIVEPGASIIASPISFITSVIDVKKTNKNYFVTTDGSRNDIDPLMTKKSYFYNIVSKRKNEIVPKQVISGFTCIENDRFFILEKEPLLTEGDIIEYKNVGSYTMCLSPLFIKYFPDVYVMNNDGVYKVREKWTTKEYLLGTLK